MKLTTGFLPILMCSIIIILVSIGFYFLCAYYQNNTLGLEFGLGVGIAGFLMVILPNLILIRQLTKDEQPESSEVNN